VNIEHAPPNKSEYSAPRFPIRCRIWNHVMADHVSDSHQAFRTVGRHAQQPSPRARRYPTTQTPRQVEFHPEVPHRSWQGNPQQFFLFRCLHNAAKKKW